MADKDCAANMNVIAGWADRIVTLTLPGPRAATATALASLVPAGRATPAEDEPLDVIRTFRASLAPATIGVLCGSFVLAGIGRRVVG